MIKLLLIAQIIIVVVLASDLYHQRDLVRHAEETIFLQARQLREDEAALTALEAAAMRLKVADEKLQESCEQYLQKTKRLLPYIPVRQIWE